MRRGGYEPFQGPMRTKNWGNPTRWNERAFEAGKRSRVFTCSMSDFFHPGADKWRSEAWDVIANCPSLDWLILTKRVERVIECLPSDWGNGYSNVWLGVTAGCSKSLTRVEQLLNVPAAIRFVSAEPLLEQVDFSPYLWGLDWMITGCERAKKGSRRTMELQWVREIDSQCRSAGVAHFFKQYYKNDIGLPSEDGLLDGVLRQDFPVSPAACLV